MRRRDMWIPARYTHTHTHIHQLEKERGGRKDGPPVASSSTSSSTCPLGSCILYSVCVCR